MATGRSIGTIYAEIDLDSSRYLRSQQQLYKSATTTTLSIEQNFKNLGIKTSAEFDLMRARVENAYNGIRSSAKATENDLVRAAQARAAQLKAIDEQQFGHQVGLLQSLKSNYFQVSASIAASIYAIQQIGAPFARIFEKGFDAVETYGQSVASLAAMVVTFTERQKGMTMSDQWKEALAYSTEMVPILENIAAKTLLSGQETTALANAFARAGVFLDASNSKQVESFTRISNALPLLTQGQEIMRQINTEIRAVMTGANESTSMMLQTLKAVDPEVEKNLKTWRAEGTVMEHIGELLSGFGPATALLENQWQAVKSTLDTTVTQVLRGSMKPAYDDIIARTKDINAFLDEHRGMIQGGIRIGWATVQDLVGAAKGMVSGMSGPLMDMAAGVGMVAYGWDGVLAVLKPVGAFLGNSVTITWELAKMIGNAVVATAAMATMQADVARVAWSEAQKSFANVEKYSAANRDLLVNGLADAVAGYGNRTAAAMASEKAIRDASAASKQFQAKNIDAVTEAQKAGAKKRETAEKQLEAEIEKTINERQKLTGNLYAYKAQEIDRDLNKYREAGVAEVDIARLKTEKLKNLYEEVSKAYRESMAKWDKDTLAKMEAPGVDLGVTQEMLTAYSTLYAGIVARTQQAADAQEALIYEQGNKFYEVTKDEVAVAEWEAEQLEKLYIERAKYSNDWRDGLKAGLLEIQRDATTWGGAMQSLSKSTFTNMSSTFSTVFYDAITGKFENIGDAFEKMGESMLKNLTDIMGKMAAEEILLFFKSQWTSGGADVLKLVNNVLGLASTAIDWLGGSGGSTTTTTTSVIAYEGGRIPYVDGGRVAGQAHYPGDHPGNDTVPAWLSPDEVVIRRSAVNTETGPTLDYINRFRRLPPGVGLFNGGSVAGTVTDQPYRGYWGLGEVVDFVTAVATGGGSYLATALIPNSQSLGRFIDTGGGSIWDWIHAFADPTGTVTGGTRTLGSIAPRWVADIVQVVAPVIGAIWGPGGAAAGSGIAADWYAGATGTTVDRQQAMMNAGMAAVATYIAQGFKGAGWTAGTAEAGYQGASLTEAAKSAALGFAKKWAINEFLGKIIPADQVQSGQMTLSYEGSNAGPILQGLNQRMNDLATREYAVSARDGLSYVPRDNYRINAHKGEAVLNEEDAREWREGNRGGDTLNFNFYGDVYDKTGLARDLLPEINKALKARVH